MNPWFDTHRVVVTGAAGWLGRGLLRALAQGLPDVKGMHEISGNARIRACDLPGGEDGVRAVCPQAEYVASDIRSAGDCRRMFEDAEGATLFHLAGVIHPRKAREFFEVNYEGGRNVLRAAIEARVERAVVMSSNSPLGCNPHVDHLFDEASPHRPYMGYGRSKMMLEQHVQQVQAEGRLETVTVRAPWFYGPLQPPRQKLFFEMIRDGKAPIVGGGENRRSMAYIDNLAQGLILAATTPHANGQTYWIADERPYTMNEIVDTIERLLETEFGQVCRHKRMRLPGLAAEIAGIFDGSLQALGLYHQKLHVLSEMNKTIACSIEKAKHELGYCPAIALEEGMRRSLRDLWPESQPA